MRKAKPKKRIILPDPVFNDVKVSKFVNHLMYDGKKSISYEIFYNALEVVASKMGDSEKSSLEIWKEALDKITPQVEVKSRRIGGATFLVSLSMEYAPPITMVSKPPISYISPSMAKSREGNSSSTSTDPPCHSFFL